MTEPIGRLLSHLATHHSFVGVLADGISRSVGSPVRTADLRVGEDFADEWTFVAVGQSSFTALIARDLGDSGPEPQRRFRYVLTEDRLTVAAAARSLMSRMATDRPDR